jgi:hypothetical protein
MKLIDLLAHTSDEELERLAHEHAHASEKLSRAHLLSTIEGVLRSHRFLHEYLFNRHPPTFAILTTLLDAENYASPAVGFKDLVNAETKRLTELVAKGEVLARDDQLRVYRRVLYQALSNDNQIDPSEASLLAVLRNELEVTPSDHFLICHHPELSEYWDQPEAFIRELHALRSAGVVFVRDGLTVLPEDVAQVVRHVIGVEVPRLAMRRFFKYLTNAELGNALQEAGAPSGGAKDERIERLVTHLVQPRTVMRQKGFTLERLRELCDNVGARTSGNKDELVDRIVTHVAAGRDIVSAPEPPPPIEEDRMLTEERFTCLFAQLRGHELLAILGEFELRKSGTKETLARTLWLAHRAESSLLEVLSNGELEKILVRLDLRTTGNKSERIARLVDHFAQMTPEQMNDLKRIKMTPEMIALENAVLIDAIPITDESVELAKQ